MSELLTISNLRITFPGQDEPVQDVSIKISRGESVGVLGASGAGKSLTAWAVSGVLPPSGSITGRIVYTDAKGHTFDLLNNLKNRKGVIGKVITMIPQNPFTSLNPAIKCGKQVEEMLRNASLSGEERKTRVLDWLSQLAFEDPGRIYSSYPLELSGGQLQRVVIAMATITNPALLIADEPTTALDTVTQKAVLQWLSDWAEHDSRSILFISHDLGVLSSLCSRISIIENGRTINTIEATGLARLSAHPSVRSFIEHRPENLRFERGTDTRLNSNSEGLMVRSLTKSFTGRQGMVVDAIKGVSFTVAKGECVGLVGATGCGKSTIARILAGLAGADGGEMIFEERPIDYERFPELRREIQMIFQDPYSALYPHKTVREILAEPIRLHQTAEKNEEEQLIELLTQVELPMDLLDKYPDELSGGERQRVQIARALSVSPTFLICDESVSGLDMPVQAKILGLLHDLKRQTGVAILFISHDLSVVRCIADRVLIMDSGQIVEEGRNPEIMQDPQNVITKAMLEAIPSLKA